MRAGFITYDLQPFTEDCLFRVAEATEGRWRVTAYPVISHRHQASSRVAVRPSRQIGRYLGVEAEGSTPEGLAWNLNAGAAINCVRESDVVVLFGLQGATALLAACLGRLAARPLISVNQTLPVKEERRRRWWLRLLKGTLLAQCDLHIVQNPPAEDVLTSVYRVPSSRLISAPFEAGARLFGGLLAAAPGRDFARRQFGLGGELVCAFVGNLHPFKGVPALLSAAGHLGVESSWRFLFAGPEEPRNRRGGTIERYLAQARRLGVESRVRFLGTLSPESLVQLYKAADVVALPTARDMFPKILVEAALAGLPLITTDACGAAGAVVRDGENGFVLPVGDSHAIAAALGRLADPELRRTMGARSRELVGIACSAESETAGFVAALDAVCVTHRQARARDR